MNISRILPFTAILCLIIASCTNPESRDEHHQATYPTTIQIPQGAIPIHYDGQFSISGHFNDTVKATWYYDTGCPDAVADKSGDGILPVDFFGNNMVEVNYAQEYILLHPDDHKPDSSWTAIPFVFAERRILIDGSIMIEKDKHLTGPFILDLGSSGTFTLNAKASQELHITDVKQEIEYLDLLHGASVEKQRWDCWRPDPAGSALLSSMTSLSVSSKMNAELSAK